VATAVTVLGTGIMGAGMAKNLAGAGFDVTVWNRSPEKAQPLSEAGATVAPDVAAAVADADIVLTMLFDLEAVTAVMEQALPAVPGGTVWVQSSTVGVDGTVSLARLAERHGVGFVDAPVLGTRQPAEQGTLTVLAGAPTALREAVSPVFDAIGSRTVWVGEQPGDGHRLKLTVNSWVLSVVAGTAQAVELAGDLGLDPQMFLDTIAGTPSDCAYAQLKGKAMLAKEFPPAFPLVGALKDAALIAQAMHAVGTDDRLMQVVQTQFEAAADAGHGDEDMAAVVYAFRR
jgi:3-hydroxyisobutyrate dehydrogenase